jgi:hypothetical protein
MNAQFVLSTAEHKPLYFELTERRFRHLLQCALEVGEKMDQIRSRRQARLTPVRRQEHLARTMGAEPVAAKRDKL